MPILTPPFATQHLLFATAFIQVLSLALMDTAPHLPALPKSAETIIVVAHGPLNSGSESPSPPTVKMSIAKLPVAGFDSACVRLSVSLRLYGPYCTTSSTFSF